jgi:molybdate transport system ATP-binding protein
VVGKADTPTLGADTVMALRIERRFSATFVLNIAFEIPAGFTMLLGPSGSGKTVTLNSLGGLIQPDLGWITLNSHLLFDSASRVNLPPQQRRVGYLFQDLALFPHLTIARNIEYGIARLPAKEKTQRITPLVQSFRIAHLLQSKPREISGGERQRAALARSLVTKPEALLLDEPLAALDHATKATIIDDLREWNEVHRIPILYVTHSPEEAFALGQRVIVLKHGRVLASGTPQEVLQAPRHETIAQWVGFENVFDASVAELREHDGTMTCRIGDGGPVLEVPLSRVSVGSSVRIAIRAGDIVIASERPRALSARNCFQGRITRMKREGVTEIVSVDCGAIFTTHLTPSACHDLKLELGMEVWLVIKTYSCNLLEARNS